MCAKSLIETNMTIPCPFPFYTSSADCLDPSCSGHGTCVNGQCYCKAGWQAEDCGTVDQQVYQCLPGCSEHGTYDLETATCVCDRHWTGHDCSQGKIGGIFNLLKLCEESVAVFYVPPCLCLRAMWHNDPQNNISSCLVASAPKIFWIRIPSGIGRWIPFHPSPFNNKFMSTWMVIPANRLLWWRWWWGLEIIFGPIVCLPPVERGRVDWWIWAQGNPLGTRRESAISICIFYFRTIKRWMKWNYSMFESSFIVSCSAAA